MMLPIEPVVSEMNRLKAAGIIADYAIGGAVAALAYNIEVPATEDVDVFVVFAGQDAMSIASLGRIWADLTAHGATELGDHLVIGGWPVHFLPPGQPLYDEAIATARPRMFGAHEGRIISPEHLAAIAIATGRPVKDYTRVVEFLRRGVVKQAELEELVARFGLQDNWTKFKTRFLSET